MNNDQFIVLLLCISLIVVVIKHCKLERYTQNLTAEKDELIAALEEFRDRNEVILSQFSDVDELTTDLKSKVRAILIKNVKLLALLDRFVEDSKNCKWCDGDQEMTAIAKEYQELKGGNHANDHHG